MVGVGVGWLVLGELVGVGGVGWCWGSWLVFGGMVLIHVLLGLRLVKLVELSMFGWTCAEISCFSQVVQKCFRID